MATDEGTDPKLDIVAGDFWGSNPLDELRWLRDNDPIYFDEAHGVWGFTRYADIKDASKDSKLWSSAGGIRPDAEATAMMIDLDDPDHIRRRKLVNKGFTPNKVRAQGEKAYEVVDYIIDQVCDRGEADFVMEMAAWLPLIMIGDSLGYKKADRQKLLTLSDNMMSGLGQDDPVAFEKTAMAAFEYAEYATAIFADRRENPQEDLVSTLVHAEVDGEGLTEEQLIMDTLLILIGGDETTRHVITGGLYQLLTNRDQWDQLKADRSLLPGAIEEMLRWVTPIKNMARTATRDVEVHGKHIKQGEKILLIYPSANRDERQFPNPDVFDIHRTPNDHLAFGFGTHFCLGTSLARLELQAMFERLLDRLPDIELASPVEPPFRAANFVSGYEEMKVTFTPVAPVGADA